MKKSLLALSLLAFVGLGLASCSPSETTATSVSAPQGDKGDTGQKGPTGDKGPVGDTGPSGSQGLDGQDGSKGPTGDKGPTGETGDKGPDGSDGVDGEKTYSTTVLGNEHGWIDVSVASATVGTDVTYTVHDYDATDAWQFKSLTLNESTFTFDDMEKAEDGTYKTTVKMVEGGYLASCEFVEVDTTAEEVLEALSSLKDGENVINLKSDLVLGKPESGTTVLNITTTENQSLVLDGNGATIEVEESTDASAGYKYIDLANAKGDVTIRNINFVKDTQGSGYDDYGIYMGANTTGDIIIENCTFASKGQTGKYLTANIWLDGGNTNNIIIRNNVFKNRVINMHGGTGTVNNVTIENNDFTGISLVGYNSITVSNYLHNTKIVNNTYSSDTSSYDDGCFILFHKDFALVADESESFKDTLISGNVGNPEALYVVQNNPDSVFDDALNYKILIQDGIVIE